MTIRIERPVRGGTVRAIASKSEVHRLLICAALAEQTPHNQGAFISCPECSDDIHATSSCLKAMGAEIRYENDGFFVKPINRTLNSLQHKGLALDCGESGSTLRFLLPVCGALGLSVSFRMKGRLPNRPLEPLYKEMTSHGCTLSEPGLNPLSCEGHLNSGTYTLPGNISSQYVSGLLFALPLLSGDSIIRITGVLESRPYVDMTLDTLKKFGITILENRDEFFIEGGQSASFPEKIKTGGDWSNAAFWLSAGAIVKGNTAPGKAFTCTGLDPDSLQGDRAIVELLKRFGAAITESNDSVTVLAGALHGIDIDAADTPDLVPILAALASVAEGKTTIRNAGRLRNKESDRLKSVALSLSVLGADIREREDSLEITGKKDLPGGITESFGDHRIAMAAAILSAACTGPVIIQNAEAVRKSYPNFFEDLSTAFGGEYVIVE